MREHERFESLRVLAGSAWRSGHERQAGAKRACCIDLWRSRKGSMGRTVRSRARAGRARLKKKIEPVDPFPPRRRSVEVEGAHGAIPG